MEQLLEILTFQHLCFAVLVAAIAGIVKGVVGFAMPMVFVSGLSTFLSPELALAGLIVPTLCTNVFQALRQGPAAAWNSIIKFRVFLFFGFLGLIVGAQLVRILPLQTMLLVIGLPIVLFALLQLAGVEVKLSGQSFPCRCRNWHFCRFHGWFVRYLGATYSRLFGCAWHQQERSHANTGCDIWVRSCSSNFCAFRIGRFAL